MSQTRIVKAAMRSGRQRAVRDGAYNPLARREKGSYQAEIEVRGLKTDGLVQNFGALLMQSGVVPEVAVETLPMDRTRPAPKELPNTIEHRIYKVCIVKDGQWTPVATVYDHHFAVMFAIGFYEKFKLDVKVLDHLNDNEVVRFSENRDRYVQYARNLKAAEKRAVQLEEKRKKAVSSKKADEKVEIARVRAVPILPTGANGRTLKEDIIKAVEKMRAGGQINPRMTMEQLRAVHTKVYKSCLIAPPGLGQPPRKKVVKKVVIKKVIKKIPAKVSSNGKPLKVAVLDEPEVTIIR